MSNISTGSSLTHQVPLYQERNEEEAEKTLTHVHPLSQQFLKCPSSDHSPKGHSPKGHSSEGHSSEGHSSEDRLTMAQDRQLQSDVWGEMSSEPVSNDGQSNFRSIPSWFFPTWFFPPFLFPTWFLIPPFLFLTSTSLFGLTWTLCGSISLLVTFATINSLVKLLLNQPSVILPVINTDWISPILSQWLSSSYQDFNHTRFNGGPLIESILSEDESKYSSYRQCLECGDIACERHSKEESINLIPWKGLLVDEEVNEALEDILNETMKYYIDSWYRDLLSTDSKISHATNERLVCEIKIMIRYLISNLIIKIKDQDIADIVIKDMIASMLNHYEMYLIGKRSSKSAPFIELSTLHEYEKWNQLHPALKSRNDEISWLQNLSRSILPYLIPSSYLNPSLSASFLRELLASSILLPAIDIVCDPDVINKLIINSIDTQIGDDGNLSAKSSESKKIKMNENHSKDGQNLSGKKMIEILSSYSIKIDPKISNPNSNSPKHKRRHCTCNQLGVSFKSILSDEQMLFLFMQFLKQESAVNLIQFLLSVDALTMSLMDPELTDDQLRQLYQESISVYNNYMKIDGVDSITFRDQKIVDEMEEILFGSSSRGGAARSNSLPPDVTGTGSLETPSSNQNSNCSSSCKCVTEEALVTTDIKVEPNHACVLGESNHADSEMYKNVVKLRNSETLYAGREEVYQLLESHYACLFFDSASFLKMVAGSRWSLGSSGTFDTYSNSIHGGQSPTLSISSVNGSMNNNGVLGKRVRSRNHTRQSSLTLRRGVLRDTLWPSIDDGLIPPSITIHPLLDGRNHTLLDGRNHTLSDGRNHTLSDGRNHTLLDGRNASSVEEIPSQESNRIEHALDVMEALGRKSSTSGSRSSLSRSRSINDLSGWKVSIPRIETRLDSNLKYFHVFSISVERIDIDAVSKSREQGSSESGNDQGSSESGNDLDLTLTDQTLTESALASDANSNFGSNLSRDANLNEAYRDESEKRDGANKWIVERRYPEFYELESRLKGFHGDNLITNVDYLKLPSRKTFGDRITIPFLESKREEFEKFLQSLVSSDRLKGSQMVYNFLKCSEGTESEFTTNLLPEINIKNIFKSVPAALTQEKGQNLDPFLGALIDDIKAPKSKPIKPDSLNQLIFADDPIEFAKTLIQTPVFGDNLRTLDGASRHSSRNASLTINDAILGVSFGEQAMESADQVASDQMAAEKLASHEVASEKLASGENEVFGYLMFILSRIFSLAPTSKLFQIILSVERLFLPSMRSFIEKFTHSFVAKTLKTKLASPSVVVKLINLLKDALYPESKDANSLAPIDEEKEKRKRKDEAFEALTNLIKSSINGTLINSSLINTLISDPVDYDQLSYNLFQLFQYPLLNKQLMYIWLDQILKRIFPQIYHSNIPDTRNIC